MFLDGLYSCSGCYSGGTITSGGWVYPRCLISQCQLLNIQSVGPCWCHVRSNWWRDFSFSWLQACSISQRGKYLIPSGTVMTNPAVVGTLVDRPMIHLIWKRPYWRRPSPRHICKWCFKWSLLQWYFLILSQTTFANFNIIWSTNLVYTMTIEMNKIIYPMLVTKDELVLQVQSETGKKSQFLACKSEIWFEFLHSQPSSRTTISI